jgi:hypothetical protein
MKKVITYVLLGVFTLGFSSCATIFTGSRQTVKVQTIPPGADVYVEGEKMGTTPTEVSLKKGFNPENVVVKKEGFDNKTIPLNSTFNPVALLNLFGLLGWAIDGATGSMMKYDKKFYEVTLDAKTATPAAAPASGNK